MTFTSTKTCCNVSSSKSEGFNKQIEKLIYKFTDKSHLINNKTYY